MVCTRMVGSGSPGGIRCTWVGILTSTTIPRVRNLIRLPSWKAERIWEWVASGGPSWKIPRIHLSEFPVSKDGWTKGNEGSIALFFKQKCCFFMPFSAHKIFFLQLEKRHSYKSSIRSKFTSYLYAFTRFCPTKVFESRYVYRFASILQMSY